MVSTSMNNMYGFHENKTQKYIKTQKKDAYAVCSKTCL